MSEKRFEMSDQSTVYRYSIIDNENGVLKVNECVILLNKLNDENEQLRQSVEYWQKKYEEGTETFQIKNEELRQRLKEKEEDERLYAEEIVRLNETNKQIKENDDLLGGY